MSISFIKESIKNLMTVGTITRSSAQLCKRMIKEVDFKDANIIIELGAGDGVVTEHILKRMKPNAVLYAFEVNEAFCKKLEAINDDRLVVMQKDVMDIESLMKELNVDTVDYIISAIPFVVFKEEDTQSVIEQCQRLLKASGFYVQIHYSLVLKKLYQRLFESVDIDFVPINVPPAFVFTCR